MIVTDRRRYGQAHIITAWFFTFTSLGIMLPWAIAVTRGRANAPWVALVAVFTWWTFAGWVVALVMACTAHRTIAVLPAPAPLALSDQQLKALPPPR